MPDRSCFARHAHIASGTTNKALAVTAWIMPTSKLQVDDRAPARAEEGQLPSDFHVEPAAPVESPDHSRRRAQARPRCQRRAVITRRPEASPSPVAPRLARARDRPVARFSAGWGPRSLSTSIRGLVTDRTAGARARLAAAAVSAFCLVVMTVSRSTHLCTPGAPQRGALPRSFGRARSLQATSRSRPACRHRSLSAAREQRAASGQWPGESAQPDRKQPILVPTGGDIAIDPSRDHGSTLSARRSSARPCPVRTRPVEAPGTTSSSCRAPDGPAATIVR